MAARAVNQIFIEKIEVCGFGAFVEQRSFKLSEGVNVIVVGEDEREKTSLLQAIAFIFDRRFEDFYRAMKCKSPNAEPDTEAYVSLAIRTDEPFRLRKKDVHQFKVKRILCPDDVGDIYFGDGRRQSQPIADFHKRFPYVIVEEPFIDASNIPSGYDLMRMWRIAYELDEVNEVAERCHRSIEIEHVMDELAGVMNENDKQTQAVRQWFSMELVALEKHTELMVAQLREEESQLLDTQHRDKLRRDGILEYKRTINRIEAETKRKNYRSKCVQFNLIQRITRTFLERALVVPDNDRRMETEKNNSIQSSLDEAKAKLRRFTNMCRGRNSQSLTIKRKNHIRLFKKVTDLNISQNEVDSEVARSAAIVRLERDIVAFESLIPAKAKHAFAHVQTLYGELVSRIDQIHENNAADRQQFIQHIQQKYASMLVNLPIEIKLLEHTGQMLESFIRITDLLSDYFDFFNHQSFTGFKITLAFMTNPANSFKFAADFCGNVLDFIRLDRIDDTDTFIKYVVPVIMDLLLTFVFDNDDIGTELVDLIRKESAGLSGWHGRVCCNSNYLESDVGKPVPRNYRSVSEILLTDAEREQNRSLDYIFSQYLVFTGDRIPKNAQQQAIDEKKKLIFPKEKYFYNEDGWRIWIYNGTMDAFKQLLEVWHKQVMPARTQLFEWHRDSALFHTAIEQTKTNANIDGFAGDIVKFRELNEKQKKQIREWRSVAEAILANTNDCLTVMNHQMKCYGEHDARRLKLLVLQSGTFTDQGVLAAVNNIIEMIENEHDEHDEPVAIYVRNIPDIVIMMNRCPLDEQLNAYRNFIEKSIQHQAMEPEANPDSDVMPIVPESFEKFEKLHKIDVQLDSNRKNVTELKLLLHAKLLIDDELVDECRRMPYEDLSKQINDIGTRNARKGIVLPKSGLKYAKLWKKQTRLLRETENTLRVSKSLDDISNPLETSFKRCVIRHNWKALTEIIAKLNEFEMPSLRGKQIAVELKSLKFKQIIHENMPLFKFDELIDPSMQLNFVYIVRTDQVAVLRALDVNVGVIAAFYYLLLGQELNDNLLIMNWSMQMFDTDEMKFLISQFGLRSDAQDVRRQTLFVQRGQHVNLDQVFPGVRWKKIDLKQQS